MQVKNQPRWKLKLGNPNTLLVAARNNPGKPILGPSSKFIMIIRQISFFGLEDEQYRILNKKKIS